MTNYEKETIINYNAEEDFAMIYSAQEPVIRKMDKLVSEKEEAELIREDADGKTYKVPKKWVRIYPNRILSEKEKEMRKELGYRYGFKRRQE